MNNLLLVAVLSAFFITGCNSVNITPQESHFSGPEYFAIGEWRLNDSREKVESLGSLPNLKPVAVTGGLETSEGKFNDEVKNLSFVFDDQGLLYSQVWLYEGKSLDEAAFEFAKLYNFYSENLGGAVIKGLSAEGNVGPSLVESTVKNIFNNARRSVEKVDSDGMTFRLALDMKPVLQPINNKFHGMLVYTGKLDVFHVLLFEDRPNFPDRSSNTHITLQGK